MYLHPNCLKEQMSLFDFVCGYSISSFNAQFTFFFDLWEIIFKFNYRQTDRTDKGDTTD